MPNINREFAEKGYQIGKHAHGFETQALASCVYNLSVVGFLSGWMRRFPDSLNDPDLLVHWAAEEYVAAGRVDDRESRELHRRRADFFAEAFRALRQPCAMNPDRADPADIGLVLRRAFDSPWQRR